MWPIGWIKDFARNQRLAKMYDEEKMLDIEDENDIRRLIATDVLEVYDTHLLLNKLTYVRCIVGGLTDEDLDALPPGITEQAHERIMSLATDGARIEICAGFIKIPRMVMNGDLEATYNDASVDQKNVNMHNEGSLKSVKLQLEKNDIESTCAGIHYHSFNAYDTTYIITIMGDEKEVKQTEANIIGVLNSELIEWHSPLDLMLPAFVASRPYPKSDSRFQIRVNSETAAILCPTTALNNTIDDEGMLFGTDINTGSQIVINERAKKSRHRKYFGSTGSGKSFTVSEHLHRAISFYGCRGCVITPKHELDNFIALAKYYKERGKVIFIDEDGFNPIEIVIDTQASGDSKRAYLRSYYKQVKIIKAGLDTWLNPSDSALGYIEDTIHRLYSSMGIDRHRPETFKPAKWKKFPDLYKTWVNDSTDESLSIQTRNVAASLVMKAKAISEEGTLQCFNKEVEPIDYSNLDLLVFDISGIDEDLQDMVNVLVTGILSNRFSTVSDKETIIVVDEARVFMRNKRANEFLKDGVALGRSYGVWFWIITQNPSDFEKNNADEEFKMNIPISVIMGADIDPSNISQVKDYFGLADSQAEQLLGCQPGEGLLIVNGEVYFIRFEPSDLEYATIKGLDIQEAVIPGLKLDGYKIKPEFQEIVNQSHLILKEMIEGDESKLIDEGWIKKTRQPTIKGRGSCTVWYKKGEIKQSSSGRELVNRPDIGSMTFEHMLGVTQVQTWLKQHDIKCEVDHTGGQDVVFYVNGKKYAVEWEIAHSHTFEQLKDKLKTLFSEYEDFRVACASTPEEYEVINQAIPTQYMAPRGQALIYWLESVIAQNGTKRPTPDNPFESENQPEINIDNVKNRLPAFVWEQIYPTLEQAQKEALVNRIMEMEESGYYKELDERRERNKKALEEEEEHPQDQREMIIPLVSDGPEANEVI